MNCSRKIAFTFSILASILVFAACTAEPESPPAATPAQADAPAVDPVDRGEHLVTVLACDDCHTPMVMGEEGPAPDMTRRLSGHPEGLVMPPAPKLEEPWLWVGSATNTAFAGPWGVTYAINLTPDENTGLGIWTEEMFVKSIKEGKHMGASRPIMPPMPWPAYSHLPEEDLRAMYAYLRSLEPIANRVPEYEAPAGGEAGPAAPAD